MSEEKPKERPGEKPPQAPQSNAPATKTPREWAQEKGHIPKPGIVARGGKRHTGPVFEHARGDGGIKVHMFRAVPREQRWYENSQITEAEYEAGVKLALGVCVGLSHPAEQAEKKG